MKISVFGLGYVGCVGIACLAEQDNQVIGVDVVQNKIDLINSGKPTIVEKDINTLMKNNHKKGLISATNSSYDAVINTEVSMICVGTPLGRDGNLNLNYVFSVIENIAKALKDKKTFHVILIRSTVMPGTNEKICKMLEKLTGKKRNVDFGVVSNPEFLREGTAIEDYFNPPVTVIGTSCDKSYKITSKIYAKIPSSIINVDVKEAELIKYVNNSYHALKISFANEIGNICKKINIDSFKVMDIFCMDEKLNISSKYFKPGFAYGGSCLPKDLSALTKLAESNNLHTPLLNSISETNENQKQIAFDIVKKHGKRKIGILGLSFKKGTDDLRCSPIVDVARQIINDGCDLLIHDEYINYTKLNGINKEYIDQNIPDLSELLVTDFNEIISHSELIIINHDYGHVTEELIRQNKNKIFIDLANLNINPFRNYDGICW